MPTALSGGANPAPQSVRITNLTSQAVSFTAAAAMGSPFSVTPASGNVAPNTPAQVTIQANTSNLAVGIYRGTLTLTFPQRVPRAIDLLLVVTPLLPPGPSNVFATGTPPAASCTATKLLPQFTQLAIPETA